MTLSLLPLTVVILTLQFCVEFVIQLKLDSGCAMDESPSTGKAREAVLSHSGPLPVEPVEVSGYDFNMGVNYEQLIKSFFTTGFQATNFGMALHEINRMVNVEILEYQPFLFSIKQ